MAAQVVKVTKQRQPFHSLLQKQSTLPPLAPNGALKLSKMFSLQTSLISILHFQMHVYPILFDEKVNRSGGKAEILNEVNSRKIAEAKIVIADIRRNIYELTFHQKNYRQLWPSTEKW